jgi:DNA-binding LacI/PurR family transcriptional regulator
MQSVLFKDGQNGATHGVVAGFWFVLLDSDERADKEAEGVLFAAQMYAAGIMLASINSCAHAVPLIREQRLAAVGLSSYDLPEAFDIVTVHKQGGTNLAVRHLVELGHRQIVFAGGRPSSGIATGRREGFERQMRREGLPLTDESIYETGFSQEDGYRAGVRFLALDPLPTAICCANDLNAFGVINALNDRGIRVPEDVSVTGMDDVPMLRSPSPD